MTIFFDSLRPSRKASIGANMQGFPKAIYTWGGGICPPPYGGTSAKGQSVNGGGGLMRGDIGTGHRYMGAGDLTLIDYIIN